MLYVTGDTHIPIDTGKLSPERFPAQLNMSKSDYLIICGDFGGVWYPDAEHAKYLERLDSANFTTLWVDGNHENFDMLKEYPVSEWNGGKVQYIKPSVIHLMRGQVFDTGGVTLFTMGGGYSIDKHLRIPTISWWPEEMPSNEEYAEALSNLKKHNNKVDYIITHTASASIVSKFYYPGANHELKLNMFFEKLEKLVEYKHWYFGHIHLDEDIDDAHTLLYRKIIPLGASFTHP